MQWIGHSTNLVGHSAAYIADVSFNDNPRPLHIAGVREMNSPLFEMLDFASDLDDAGEAFNKYMDAMFGIDPEQREAPRLSDGRRRYRSSWLRLLKGWGYDSNGPEGAVLKGWVESRFGLFPTWHKAPLVRFATGVWTTYVEEKMSSRFHNNAILTQLDLLYEFCQWAFHRFVAPGQTHLVLYRGINDLDQHEIERGADRHHVIVRLNSLSSFTSEEDIAGCFGEIVLEVAVPLAKILFYNMLLPPHPLKCEGEYLVIGGNFRARLCY